MDTPRGTCKLAWMLYEECNLNGAIDFYQRALAQAHDDALTSILPEANLVMGYCYAEMGRWGKAEELYRQCIKQENFIEELGAYGAAAAYFHLSLSLEKRAVGLSGTLGTSPAKTSYAIKVIPALFKQIEKYRQIAVAMDPKDTLYKESLLDFEEKMETLYAPYK